jgi:ABC-type molybdenum transport system ATPase subunit/photorepair protein PhrA
MENKTIQSDSNVAVADKPQVGEGLVIKDLHVSVAGREILKGVSLTVRPGEVHAPTGRASPPSQTPSWATPYT